MGCLGYKHTHARVSWGTFYPSALTELLLLSFSLSVGIGCTLARIYTNRRIRLKYEDNTLRNPNDSNKLVAHAYPQKQMACIRETHTHTPFNKLVDLTYAHIFPKWPKNQILKMAVFVFEKSKQRTTKQPWNKSLLLRLREKRRSAVHACDHQGDKKYEHSTFQNQNWVENQKRSIWVCLSVRMCVCVEHAGCTLANAGCKQGQL